MLAFWFQLGLDVWFFQACLSGRPHFTSSGKGFPQNAGIVPRRSLQHSFSWLNFTTFSHPSLAMDELPLEELAPPTDATGWYREVCHQNVRHRAQQLNVRGLTSRTRAWTLGASKVGKKPPLKDMNVSLGFLKVTPATKAFLAKAVVGILCFLAMAAEVPVLRLPHGPHQRHVRPIKGVKNQLRSWFFGMTVQPWTFKVDDEHDATTRKKSRKVNLFVFFFGAVNKLSTISLEAEGAMLGWPCCHGSGDRGGSGSFVLCARLSGITSWWLALTWHSPPKV